MKITFDNNGHITSFEDKKSLYNYLAEIGALCDEDIPNTPEQTPLEKLIEIYFAGNGNIICKAGRKKYGMKHHKLIELKP